MLMCAGKPQAFPHELIENLILAADEDGTVHFDFPMREGQTVKVTAGPFADFLGKLEHLDDNGRVSVLLEMMGGNSTSGIAADH